MREIKFRAWLKPSKQMARVTGIDLERSGTFRVLTPDNQIIWFGGENSNAIVMQFTGLTDKNGKEIYEGDILVTRKFAPVEVSKGNFFVNWGDWPDWSWDEMVSDHMRRIEIIGNIYENPELLEGAK